MNERSVWCEQVRAVVPGDVDVAVRWRTQGTARWMEPDGSLVAQQRSAARLAVLLARSYVAPLPHLTQFQRLATGIMRDDHGSPLLLFERVDFAGCAVVYDVVEDLAAELDRGLHALADIATPAWELTTADRTERHLVLHPRGVVVRRGRDWRLVLDPDGLVLERDGATQRIDPSATARVEHLPGDLVLRQIDAVAVFAPAVVVLREALVAAGQQRCSLQVFATRSRPG